ncbi:hypothetical protein ACFW1A_04585 [Kitasatospora sp. NPDC058965]|uniref:hypothetical protein n=1 Tax=Kitasatospora sp. NPDC058965 TaxID=3346682 RepID=UPI0036C3DFCE
MTPDQCLRAVAAMEASWKRDAQALVTLTRPVDGEAPLALVLAEFAERALQQLAAAHLDSRLAQEAGACEESLRNDPVLTATVLLATTYHCWSETAAEHDVLAAASLARCILIGLAGLTDVDPADERVEELIAWLRERALDGTWSEQQGRPDADAGRA